MANNKKATQKKTVTKKKKSRRIAVTKDVKSMFVSVEFRLGAGEITAKLFRKTSLVDTHTWDTTGNKIFTDTKTGDELSITGACSGKALLSTNRSTTPASSPSTARKYNPGPILDSLGIN